MRPVLLAVLVYLAFVFSRTEWRGITVTLENAGATTLDSVVVQVTGRGYAMGSLDPGERRSVRVEPTGDSHVEVRHAATASRLVLDTYFEPGYRQHIRASITADSVLTLDIDEAFR